MQNHHQMKIEEMNQQLKNSNLKRKRKKFLNFQKILYTIIFKLKPSAVAVLNVAGKGNSKFQQ